MKDVYSMTDGAIVAQIGAKLKAYRIAQGMTQQELAQAAGVSVFTVSAVENGKPASMLTFIQLLRAMQRLDNLSPFLAEEPLSPLVYASLMRKNHRRQRVRRNNAAINNKASSTW